MSNQSIKVVVRNTEEVVFEGPVDRISSFNEVGRFDVFPMHANFISIIQKELALYNEHRLVKEMKLEKAIMKVKRDEVNIFLGIESLAIDEKTLEDLKVPDVPLEKNNFKSSTNVKK